MTYEPRKLLDDFMNGMGKLGKTYPAVQGKFMDFLGVVNEAHELDEKTKELIACSIAVYARCPYCIAFHVHSAYKAGATKGEIMEAGMVALEMGAGPSATYLVTVYQNACEEFEHDFE